MSKTHLLFDIKATCTHDFKAQHGSVQGAVSEQPQTTCVSCHVSPDLAAALCSKIQRHDVVSLLQVERQVLQHTTRLTGQNTWGKEAECSLLMQLYISYRLLVQIESYQRCYQRNVCCSWERWRGWSHRKQARCLQLNQYCLLEDSPPGCDCDSSLRAKTKIGENPHENVKYLYRTSQKCFNNSWFFFSFVTLQLVIEQNEAVNLCKEEGFKKGKILKVFCVFVFWSLYSFTAKTLSSSWTSSHLPINQRAARVKKSTIKNLLPDSQKLIWLFEVPPD